MAKKWKVPSSWGKYIPDKDEKGFNSPKIGIALDKIGSYPRRKKR